MSLEILALTYFLTEHCDVLQVADNYYRPDLKKAALARLSAVHRSLKVAKSGVKKRNRQALKVHGRK
jgi:large subunit ribosomal protein L28e